VGAWLSGIAGVILGCAAWSLINFGSLRLGWLYASGARVLVDPSVVTIWNARPGERRVVYFQIRNLTTRSVEVLGLRKSCECISTDSLPLSLPPRGAKEVHVVLDLPKQLPSESEQPIAYHTSYPSAPLVHAKLAVRAIQP
jgi:hypothetical protein